MLQRPKRHHSLLALAILVLALAPLPWVLAEGTTVDLLSTGTVSDSDSSHYNGQTWDKSNLSFTAGCTGDCDEITATVCNGADSGDMQGTTTWELYWIASGNPKDGIVIDSGTINALAAGECQVLTYKPNDNPNGPSGNYMFKGKQRPGHPGTGDLWSAACTLTCLTVPAHPVEKQPVTNGNACSSIDIEKYVSVDDAVTWHDADTPPGPEVLEGSQTVWFKFVVTNDGPLALSNVTLSDTDFNTEIAAQCTVPSTLPAGESFECVIGPFTAISGQHSNTATATGGYVGQAPGTIIITKETRPPGGSGFGFLQDIDSTGDFTLNHGQSKIFSCVVPDQYTVTEKGPPHSPDLYVLTGLVCVDSNPQGVPSTTDLEKREATINLDPGETVTCTYTNTELGTITIKKETRPGGGKGFWFSQDVDQSGDFPLVGGESITHYHVLPGQYTVTEHDPRVTPGFYDLIDLACEDSDGQGQASTTDLENRRATINLDPGETVTCTFTNREWGKIVVEKATDPGGSPTAFSFSGKINAALKDGEQKGRRVPPGTYTVQEMVPGGWDLTGISCSNDRSGGDLGTATATYRVYAGETVRCTFTNTQRGKITVAKQTHPTGAKQAFTFSGAIDAGLKDGESSSRQVEPGTYQVTEAVPIDWSLTSITCDDHDSTGDKGTGTATFRVSPGEHVTCTFANARGGAIIVRKKTLPAGVEILFPFQGDAAGAIGDGGTIVVADLQPGTYTSRELVPDGWRLTNIECSDADSSGDVASATATFRLQADEVVTCTFSNQMDPYPVYVPLVLR